MCSFLPVPRSKCMTLVRFNMFLFDFQYFDENKYAHRINIEFIDILDISFRRLNACHVETVFDQQQQKNERKKMKIFEWLGQGDCCGAVNDRLRFAFGSN